MINLQFSGGRVFIFFVALMFTQHSFSQEVRKIKAAELEKIISESNKPLVVNMWATWCKPCIEEIPYFLEEIKEHNKKRKDSIDVLLVSLDFKEDFPEKLTAFVKKRKFNVPVAWLDETDADYFCPKVDPTWSGGIPATLFINNKTGYRKFFEEKLSHKELKKELLLFL